MMKGKLSKKNISLSLTAVILTAGMFAGSAMAYFTAYDTAAGGVEMDLGYTKTEIEEIVEDGVKKITLENTGDFDCYVRMKVLTGNAYKDSLRYYEAESDIAGTWIPGTDGYYYYSEILTPGERTKQINVSFVFPMEVPADFNVIVIQECTPVFYDEDGRAYADWNGKADVSQSIYEQKEDEA